MTEKLIQEGHTLLRGIALREKIDRRRAAGLVTIEFTDERGAKHSVRARKGSVTARAGLRGITREVA